MIVSRLLRPMLGRQEALLQSRQVEGVWDLYLMCSSVVVVDLELECPYPLDVQPLIYACHRAHFGKFQVLEEVRGVGHAARCVAVHADWIGVRIEADGAGVRGGA